MPSAESAAFADLAEITLRTLRISGTALLLALAAGIPVGIGLGTRQFLGRQALVTTINAGMGAPPVVVGLLVALFLWRSGPLGGFGLMYSPTAMIAAQVLIAFPLVVGITLASVGALDEDWFVQVRTLGVPRAHRLLLLLREIRMGLLAAVIAALGGIVSEVGAVQMVGGNLAGETRVLSTAILMHTSMGQFDAAIGLAGVLVGMMLVLAALLTAVQQGGRTR